MKVIECCYMNEYPDDKDCRTGIDLWNTFLTEMLLLGFCVMLTFNQPMCRGDTPRVNFADVLRAFQINGWVSLLHSVYHICKKNWCFAIVHTALVGFVLLRTNCIL